MQARISGHLKLLLEHSEGEVRARACNVVGNLCRYNTTFYEPILEAGLIEVLIDRCRDFDRGTRKFATFAIGNAGEALEVLFFWSRFRPHLWDDEYHISCSASGVACLCDGQ